MFSGIKIKSCIIIFLSGVFLAFGIYNVHSCSQITEGGILGLTLLLDNLFGLSPAVTGLIMNVICYLFGWKIFGKDFIVYSAISIVGFSLAYKIFEQFEPLFPWLYQMPLLSAVIGAVFVGVGAGVCIRIGGAASGDDALAMSISELTHINIEWIYLVSDLFILALSVTYIPLTRIVYSLITVILSGQIVGIIQTINFANIIKKNEKK